MKIAQEAFDFIVGEEVTSKAYYIRHYQQPEWPRGMSGITIGIGYDLGYATRDQVAHDWSGIVSDQMLSVMQHCAGVRGDSAKNLLPVVRSAITIPWDAAITVFSNRDIPHFTAAVLTACPGAEKLSPLCLGMIVSLAFNRGVSFALQGDRYREMRNIRALIAQGNFDLIPAEIESMRRLWPSNRAPDPDLRGRREREANLFRKGLRSPGTPLASIADSPAVPAPTVIVASVPDQPARTKPPAMTGAGHVIALATAFVSAASAQRFGQGFHPSHLAMVAMFAASLVLGGIVWGCIYRWRNPK